MTRRITCYVVFATLIWGAQTHTEESRQDIFKSNMTRNDFSNLLSSLIKLNEQRVKVLQKLYHLEDYGILSEVLRSGDKKTVNGNPSNLFLIVMSKNSTDLSDRKSGYQLVDSVTSLEVAGSNNIPKLNYVLDPASFFIQNDRKEHKLTKSILTNTPRHKKRNKTTKNKIIKITNTKQPLQFRIARQKRKKLNNLFMTTTIKDTFQANESRMIEIVSKNKSTNASQRLLYSSTVAINDRSTRYNKIKLRIKKYKLTTKPIIINDLILRSKHKKSKYNLEDKDEHDNGDFFKNTTQIYGDMFTEQFLDNLKPETKVPKKKKTFYSESKSEDFDHNYDSDLKVSDIFVEKINDNNHPKPGTDKVISKVSRIAIKNIDDNNRPRTEINQVFSKVTDISVKKIDYNNHSKSETNQNILKAKVQGNQHTKSIRNKFSLLWLDNKTSRIETDRITTVLKNPDQIINGTEGSNHTVFSVTPIPNPNLDINKDIAYVDDFMAHIATKVADFGNGVPLITTDAALSVATSNILAPSRFPTTAKKTLNRNNLDFLWNPNNSKDNSNNDVMKTVKDLHNGDNHNDVKPNKVKDYNNEENHNNGKKSNEVFTLVVTDDGKGRAERMKVPQNFQLALNGFDQPETKPIARGTFSKCLNKKARKLCIKSCKSAYQNVCRRLKCTSRAKRALKKECKRSCEKTFKSSKYSDDESDASHSGSSSDESNDSD